MRQQTGQACHVWMAPTDHDLSAWGRARYLIRRLSSLSALMSLSLPLRAFHRGLLKVFKGPLRSALCAILDAAA
jgi:hypothetical protein